MPGIGTGLDRPIIGPGSLIWEHACRRYNLLTATAYGVVQTMHPAISAALMSDQSDFFQNPLDRLHRSMNPILGALFDPDREATGHMIRDRHKDIQGTYVGADGQIHHYHALSPDSFGFAHDTFGMMVETGVERYATDDLPSDWREELHQGDRGWYSSYGVSMRGVAPDRASAQKKRDYYFANVLEMTPAAELLLNQAANRELGRPPNVPKAVWKVVGEMTSEKVRLFMFGGLPEELRERHNIPFSDADRKKMAAYDEHIRDIFPHLPDYLAHFTRARKGMQAPHPQEPLLHPV